MKKWLGFIVLLALLVPVVPAPVFAIGVSPYSANATVYSDGYAELSFTVTGCSEVDLTLEGIPLTVEPGHTPVVDNRITVKITGNPAVSTGTYTGYLVILCAGDQVGTGVKVSLTVNHIRGSSVALTTTVISTPSYYGWSGGGGSYYTPPVSEVPSPVLPDSEFDSLPLALPEPPAYIEFISDNTTTELPSITEAGTGDGKINWWLLGLGIAGVAVIGFLIWRFVIRREI